MRKSETAKYLTQEEVSLFQKVKSLSHEHFRILSITDFWDCKNLVRIVRDVTAIKQKSKCHAVIQK